MCFTIIAAGLLHAQHHSSNLPVLKEDSHMEIFINMFICLSSKAAHTFLSTTKCGKYILWSYAVKKDTVLKKKIVLILSFVGPVFRNMRLNLRTRPVMCTTSEGWRVLTSCNSWISYNYLRLQPMSCIFTCIFLFLPLTFYFFLAGNWSVALVITIINLIYSISFQVFIYSVFLKSIFGWPI